MTLYFSDNRGLPQIVDRNEDVVNYGKPPNDAPSPGAIVNRPPYKTAQEVDDAAIKLAKARKAPECAAVICAFMRDSALSDRPTRILRFEDFPVLYPEVTEAEVRAQLATLLEIGLVVMLIRKLDDDRAPSVVPYFCASDAFAAAASRSHKFVSLIGWGDEMPVQRRVDHRLAAASTRQRIIETMKPKKPAAVQIA